MQSTVFNQFVILVLSLSRKTSGTLLFLDKTDEGRGNWQKKKKAQESIECLLIKRQQIKMSYTNAKEVGESISLFMFYSFFRVGKSYSPSASSLYQCPWTTSIAYTHFQTAISIGISVLTYWQPSPALTKSEFSGLQVKKMGAPSQRHSICGPSEKCILLAIYSNQLCLPLWDCAADQGSCSG